MEILRTDTVCVWSSAGSSFTFRNMTKPVTKAWIPTFHLCTEVHRASCSSSPFNSRAVLIYEICINVNLHKLKCIHIYINVQRKVFITNLLIYNWKLPLKTYPNKITNYLYIDVPIHVKAQRSLIYKWEYITLQAKTTHNFGSILIRSKINQ